MVTGNGNILSCPESGQDSSALDVSHQQDKDECEQQGETWHERDGEVIHDKAKEGRHGD